MIVNNDMIPLNKPLFYKFLQSHNIDLKLFDSNVLSKTCTTSNCYCPLLQKSYINENYRICYELLTKFIKENNISEDFKDKYIDYISNIQQSKKDLKE